MPHIPIYIINLKRTPERKLYMQRQLDAFNLSYSFIEAIDKYDLQSKEYRIALANQLGIDKSHLELAYEDEKFTTGDLACTLSHLKVLNLIIENNDPQACVLEDDGYLLPAFREILIKSQSVPYGVLMLSSQSEFGRDIIEKTFDIIKNKKWLSLYKLCHQILMLIRHLQFNRYLVCRAYSILKKQIILFRKELPNTKNVSLDIYIQICACEMGAFPVQGRLSQYKSISNHYIVQPNIRRPIDTQLTSAMAYVLTYTAAIKYRRGVVAKFSSRFPFIDTVPTILFQQGEMDLHACLPSCVIPKYNYMFWSPHDR